MVRAAAIGILFCVSSFPVAVWDKFASRKNQIQQWNPPHC